MPADSGYYWAAAAVTAAIDLVFVAALVWRVDPDLFRRSRTPLIIISALFWTGVYSAGGLGWWEECYGYLYPDRVRFLVPIYGLMSGALLAPLFWWAAQRTPGHPLLWFSALAGLHSLPGHLWAIYGKDMLTRCPILLGLDPGPALVFGVFEFIFYWCVVIVLAALATRFRARPLPGAR